MRRGTPTVVVTVGSQTLTTTADPGGAWSVHAAALSETSHSVQASVEDAAGNTGRESQVLTVDVTVPVLTIDGGPARSTSDTSPWTYGTTAEQAGTIVNVGVGGQHLTATVQPGGTWGVRAQTLASGTYDVLASITDAAGNTGSITQALTVGRVTQHRSLHRSPHRPPRQYRPDAEIRLAGHAFVGRGVYSLSRQRVTSGLNGHRARTVVFPVRLRNRGNVMDRITIRATRGSAQFRVAYLQGRTNVTARVLAGRYRSGSLRPGSGGRC